MKTLTQTIVIIFSTVMLLCAGRADAQLPFTNALALNGVNQGVSVTNFGTIVPTNEITVEFWAFTTTAAGQSAFILNPDSGTARLNGHINYGTPPSDGLTYWDFGNINSGVGRLSVSAPTGSVGQWVHYAFVVSQSGNYMRVYTNGVLQREKIGMTPMARGAYELLIGGVTTFQYHGLLAEFRIWNVARSATDVLAAYNTTLAGNEPGLLLYYRLGNRSGSVATNSATATGAAFNGRLVNAPSWMILSNLFKPSAPTVAAQPASNLTANSARLNALIAPGNLPTSWYFQYGTTTNYGGSTVTNVVNGFTVGQPFNANLNGLAPATTYHFRAVASNSLGVARGSDTVFHTGGITNFVTNNRDDSSAGSLRNVIANSVSGDVVQFNAALSGVAIILTNGELVVNHDLSIDGSSLARQVRVDGSHKSRVFNIAGATVMLNGLTITNGFSNGNYGGGIYNLGKLTLENCTITGNSSTNSGGGLYNDYNTGNEQAIIRHCTFIGNHAGYSGGALETGSTLFAENTTVVGNSSGAFGSGISVAGIVTVVNCTIVGNSNHGIADWEESGMYFTNNIVVQNGSNNINVFLPDLIGDQNNFTNDAPQLAPLGNYGGPTLTMPPLFGSPVIDAGDDSVTAGAATDQRGFARISGSHVDIGAVEFQAGLNITSTADTGENSLRAAIALAPDGATITIATNLSGKSILLTNGEIVVTKSLAIDGTALASPLQLNGNRRSRVFNFGIASSSTLMGLVITNGNSGNANGGGIYNDGELDLESCSVVSNVSSNSGGGIFNSGTGYLFVRNCTVANNTSASLFAAGGGIENLQSLGVVQCTFTGNAANGGGAIFSEAGAELSVSQSTICSNRAYCCGGGISVYATSGNQTLVNSIVSGNSAGSFSPNLYLPGIAFTTSNANLVVANPLLAPLGNFGGPTKTMPPLAGSPAIDAGDDASASSFTVDQRGKPRKLRVHVDIGAVEFTNAPAAPTVVTKSVTGQTTTSATLNGTVTPNGSRTAYYFQYGPTTGYGLATPTNFLDLGVVPVSGNITGLSPGNSYHCRLVASNRVSTVFGADVSFRTGGITNLVTHNRDDGSAGSLRTAIGSSISGDLVRFAPALSGATIVLTRGEIFVTNSMVIDAASLPKCVTVDANHRDRAFYVTAGTVVEMDALNIVNGTYGLFSLGQYGGGIKNFGDLTLSRCTLSGNDAAGAQYGGAIESDGVLTLNQCTIAGNTAPSGGGGVASAGSSCIVNQSTISGNSGGGIILDGPLTLFNSIVCGNSGEDITLGTADPASSFNLVGSGSGLTDGVNGNHVDVSDPMLASLGSNGGPLPTMPPMLGSPAIDAGNNSLGNTFVTDERGYARVINGQVDIGATEYNPLALNVNLVVAGGGKVVTNLNGSLLVNGQTYSMTATAQPTFTFTNWTGGTGGPLTFITNGATIKFVMQPNLTLQANFLDLVKPIVSITSPTGGQRLSNSLLTVSGKASDNASVTNVYFDLNDGKYTWTPVTTANHWSNWTAQVTLDPGTNEFVAKAVDSSGNESIISFVRFIYVQSDRLTVRTNGRGSITPALNGALLAISNNYSMTATPAAGFNFTGWTDQSLNLITNKPGLNFQMQSNLVLTANFEDVSNPVLAITAPQPSASTVGEFFRASGRATDNDRVPRVWYRLNFGGWNLATFTNGAPAGSTNWFVVVDLIPGTNVFSAYAEDVTGNLSTVTNVTFFYTTAPASLSGMKGNRFTDTGGDEKFSFGAGTFGAFVTVGNYTYTKSSPTTARMVRQTTAPPPYVGSETNDFIFTAPGVGQVAGVNGGDTAYWTFTTVTSLVPASILNQTFIHAENSAADVERTTYQAAGKFVNSNLFTGVTSAGSNYTYTIYSPLTAMIRQVQANETEYVILNYFATNNGRVFRQLYNTNGLLGSTEIGLFGVASTRTNNLAPTNVVGRAALVDSAGNEFRLQFPDGGNFLQFDPDGVTFTNATGTYGYTLINSNASSLDLNYVSPPETHSTVLRFIAPNFAVFTNLDTTRGAAAFK